MVPRFVVFEEKSKLLGVPPYTAVPGLPAGPFKIKAGLHTGKVQVSGIEEIRLPTFPPEVTDPFTTCHQGPGGRTFTSAPLAGKVVQVTPFARVTVAFTLHVPDELAVKLVVKGEVLSGVVTLAIAGLVEVKATDVTVVLPAGLIIVLAAISPVCPASILSGSGTTVTIQDEDEQGGTEINCEKAGADELQAKPKATMRDRTETPSAWLVV